MKTLTTPNKIKPIGRPKKTDSRYNTLACSVNDTEFAKVNRAVKATKQNKNAWLREKVMAGL